MGVFLKDTKEGTHKGKKWKITTLTAPNFSLDTTDKKYASKECAEIRLKAAEFNNRIGERAVAGVFLGFLGPVGLVVAANADAAAAEERATYYAANARPMDGPSDGAIYSAVSAMDAIKGERAALARALQRSKDSHEHTKYWYGCRIERITALAKDKGIWPEVAAIIANGTVDAFEPPTYAQQFNMMVHRMAAAEANAVKARSAARKAESDLQRTREALAWKPIEEAPDWLARMAKMNPPRIAELVVKNFSFEGNQFASVYWDQDKCAPTYFMLREFPPLTPPTGT
jgi:hypothetical protein